MLVAFLPSPLCLLWGMRPRLSTLAMIVAWAPAQLVLMRLSARQ